MIATQQVPTISILHLDENTYDTLKLDGDGNPWCVAAVYSDGMFISRVGKDAPECLQAIARWAESENYLTVRLDFYGAKVPGLPVHYFS